MKIKIASMKNFVIIFIDEKHTVISTYSSFVVKITIYQRNLPQMESGSGGSQSQQGRQWGNHTAACII